MTNAVQTNPAVGGAPAATPATPGGGVPEGWREMRDNSSIQFDEVRMQPPQPPEPREPGWFDEALINFFEFLGSIFSPIGQFLGISWPVLQWILVALVVVFVLFVAFRMVGPLQSRVRKAKAGTANSEPEWQPSEEQSTALLEDADKLAAEGRFDEATRLLLQRSVSQIAETRPDWVEPSSTARELAAIPALSEAARGAFATISERVERSLFALRTLNREDWEAARSAYANFALAKIEGTQRARTPGAEVRAV